MNQERLTEDALYDACDNSSTAQGVYLVGVDTEAGGWCTSHIYILRLSLSVYLLVLLLRPFIVGHCHVVTFFYVIRYAVHSINSPDNSPFSDSVLPVLSLPY